MRPLAVLAFMASLGACAATPSVSEGSFSSTDGTRLFYRVWGRGPDTVVVLHGGPGLSMAYVTRGLLPLARGRALVFYDQRGSGRSALVTDSAALVPQRYVEDLEALRRHFGMERLTLLGHSWGVAVAGLYALEHPERIGRLILVSGFGPRLSPHIGEFVRVITADRDSATRTALTRLGDAMASAEDPAAICREWFALEFRADFMRPDALPRLAEEACDIPPEALRVRRTVGEMTLAGVGDYDWRERLRGLAAPALVLHGDRDPIPEASAREWLEVLPGARFALLPETGHFPFAEQPARFREEVDAFLRATDSR